LLLSTDVALVDSLWRKHFHLPAIKKMLKYRRKIISFSTGIKQWAEEENGNTKTRITGWGKIMLTKNT
jgi:hypothetical protein